MSQPKWVTPDRQALLVKLFLESQSFCLYGHSPCFGTLERKEIAVCRWGKFCLNPTGEGKPCRFKPDDGKPHLPCQAHHVIKLIWHCGYGDYPCYKPYECHYELVARRLVRDWVSDDRSQRLAKSQEERKRLHALAEPREPIRGRFNTVSREIIMADQPAYYLDGLGISGLTFKPFAKVRVASSYMRLFVDIGERIDMVINKAVRHYLKR